MTAFNSLPVIKTSRLTLRELRPADAAKLHAIRSNESVNRFINRPKNPSMDDVMGFIENTNRKIQESGCQYWAITLNTANSLIGTICLFNFTSDRSRAELGYELHPDHHGAGLMQEAVPSVLRHAVEKLRLQTIVAVCQPGNHRSVNVLLKNNFVRDPALEAVAPEDIKGFEIYALNPEGKIPENA
jgi:ribosomal-protein-alanine N-acetyltransferase